MVREYILKPVDTDALTALLHKLRGELDLRPAHRRAEEDGGADIPVHTYRSFLQDLRRGAVWCRQLRGTAGRSSR